MYKEDYARFIGKKVSSLFISSDKTFLLFKFSDSSEVGLNIVGDCCSESWIEHTNGLESLYKSIISGIEEKDLGEVIPTRQDRDLLYSLNFKLIPCNANDYISEDVFQIEFRNSSNGYYGGETEISKEKIEEELTMLKEDL